MRKVRLGVLVSGRGSNLQAIMDAIKAGKLSAEILVVVSDNEKAAALDRARGEGIDAVFVDPKAYSPRVELDRQLVRIMKDYDVDLVVLAGFMRVLGAEFVEAFRHRIMNIHPSLLPAFPGLHAQRQALEHGVKVSGCTVHFVDEGVDTGPIILQRAVPVLEDDDEDSLAKRILMEEHKTYPRAIQLFAEGRLSIEGRRVIIQGKPWEEGQDPVLRAEGVSG